MAQRNEDNQRIKAAYFKYLAQAKGRDEKTVNKVADALSRYERATKFKSFKKFHIDDAIRFKAALKQAKNHRTKLPLSHSTVEAYLRLTKAFFHWLAGQAGYKSRISYADTEYFNNNRRDSRIAHTHRPVHYPTQLQCQRAFEAMAEGNPDQMRNKAAFALFMLTGTRVKAASTLRLKHMNMEEGYVFQDAREVQTKAAKTIITSFYPVDPIYEVYMRRWIHHLYEVELFGPEDPLFPKPKMGTLKGKGFVNLGLSREAYSSSQKLYTVIKTSFSQMQMHPYTPHNFRKMHGKLGDEYCVGMSDMRAWMMNFGHDSLKTTINSYVPLTHEEQMQRIKAMRDKRDMQGGRGIDL